ncbi:MAG: AI-2E family transporter [Mogibacterium sp.]|nr:AI-2E family transporter [Mogibacterium sp.]
MKRNKLQQKPWYAYTVAICIGVVLYVALTHLSAIGGALLAFGNYFSAVVLGCIIAYLINPLAMLYQRTIFKNLRKAQWTVAVLMALLTVLLLLVLLLMTLIPQLIDSIRMFIRNIDIYAASLQSILDKLGITGLGSLTEMTEQLLDSIVDYLKKNLSTIINTSTGLLKNAITLAIAVILSIYLLAAKSAAKQNCKRLIAALMPDKEYRWFMSFLQRCHSILVRYVTFSLIDSVIVGGVNAVFMAIAGMEYIGLVSVIVAVTNLIPNFGPVIGAIVGGFVLLMVKPWQALAFIAFTVILQIIDGYILKPKLFGESLGVSGLLILVAVIVMGNIFGVIGILLAIPVAAILDFVYEDTLLPMLEKRRARLETEAIE